MNLFVNKLKKVVNLGDGNTVTLKKLSYEQVLDIQESSEEETTARTGYMMICSHIDSWSGPAFSEFQEPCEDAFSQMSKEFLDCLDPHVLKMLGISSDEGNESTEHLN